MRIFFVGGFDAHEKIEYERMIRSFGAEDRLISYAFISRDNELSRTYKRTFDMVLKENLYDGVMLDSGAFTLAFKPDWKGIGASSFFEEYLIFCKNHPYHFKIALDKIPFHKERFHPDLFKESAEETYKNCIIMKDKRINCIPTFQY